MKAKKILFNGDILYISANLKDNLQKSLDKCILGAFVVKNVTVVDNVVSVTIERKCKRYYPASDGLMTLDDAAIFSGCLNKDSQMKIPLDFIHLPTSLTICFIRKTSLMGITIS